MLGHSTLADLARLRDCRRARASSRDLAGGNHDWWVIEPGTRSELARMEGAGCIRHVWMTVWSREEHWPRRIVLRMWWDDEPEPSVEVPLGDFFGMGHGLYKEFWSLPLTMSPNEGRGWNCFFAMPYSGGARVEIESQCAQPFNVYFYVDYEVHPQAAADLGRFHAQWRREDPTEGWGEGQPLSELWKAPNLDGEGNYVILEAEGRGHYVGCNLNIDCFSDQKNRWYGEGDDMIFIDGDSLPTLHGTGTEDYFNTAFGPHDEFCTPYFGITLNQGDPENWWRRKNSMYRFHIEDPVQFEKSIRVTIEHGHANKLSNDYSSTAYWYQTEPHRPFPPLPGVDARLPRR
jgi:hypothetical protein